MTVHLGVGGAEPAGKGTARRWSAARLPEGPVNQVTDRASTVHRGTGAPVGRWAGTSPGVSGRGAAPLPSRGWN